MAGLSTLLLTLLSAIEPNGYVLLPALTPTEVRHHLPIAAFTDLVPRVWVVFHDNRQWMMAFYSGGAESAPRGSGPDAGPDLALALADAEAGTKRLLPGLRAPRIFLYTPYYLRDEKLLPADQMTVDVAQYFSETLLEAVLDLLPPAGLEDRAARYGSAAPGGGTEIPAAERHAAYVSALAQFGSDAFAVAVELRRSLARQRAAGKDPCRVVNVPATLFGQWGRIFTSVEYRGLYRPAAAGRRGPRPWVLGPPLDADDKRFLVDEVFAGFWTGDVRQDFELDCP